MVQADRQPGVLARAVGSKLQQAREIIGLSYDEAAARLGCEADWLVRVETGFAVPGAEEATHILTGYGLAGVGGSDRVIELARRAASPPPWLAPHTSRISADVRDIILIEAQTTLAQVHGCLLVPFLVQTEGYFREIAQGTRPGCDIDQEWDLLSHRQAHRPSGVRRLLEVMVDERAFEPGKYHPEVVAGQIRHLLDLAASPHATVRVIPIEAPIWEKRTCNFDVLSYAGTEDRIGVSHTIIGPFLESAAIYDVWARIETTWAASHAQSKDILERHLASLS